MAGSLAVMLVAEDDEHAAGVLAALQQLGLAVARFNLSDLRATPLVAQPGALDLLVAGEWWRCDRTTTVWWHRAGVVDTSDLEPDEARLTMDEAPHILRGTLAAASVRWVDDPFATARAEHKTYQLAVAAGLGMAIPKSMVTNDASAAREFATGRRIVTKALSPGHGIAPFTTEIHDRDLDYVASAPVLLQELVVADADLRVVTVGTNAWIWRRSREPQTVDWRAADPHGIAFGQVEDDALVHDAVRLTSALGLTMSVQDWLAMGNKRVFLEANPQGRYHFLPGAEQVVPEALARHLVRPGGTPGRWPIARNRIQWDFLTKNRAPDADGVIAPTFPEPPWLAEVADYQGAIEVARRAHDDAVSGAKTAEDKGRSLLQTGLALLTITIALGAYQLTFALSRSWPWVFTLVPICGSLMFLSIACFEAQQIDRVGMYHSVKPADLAGSPLNPTNRVILAGEEEGRHLASWTSARKHTDLMQARAWFTRGLAALLVAAVLAGVCRAATQARTRTLVPVRSTTTSSVKNSER